MADRIEAMEPGRETSFDGARLLSFPGDASLGTLQIASPDAYAEWFTFAPTVAEAQGTVAVPGGTALCLRAAPSLTAVDFSALDWLTEHDLLDLSTVTAVEDVLAALISLPRLRRVRLPRGTTDFHLGILRAVPSLRELVLRDTQITDFGAEALRVLHDLCALDLAHTPLKTPGVIPLRHLTMLEALDLSFTYVGDESLFYLRSLTHLRSLTLASYHRMRTTDLGTDGVTDVGLQYLRPLVRLESLSMQSQGVTDAGLAILTDLTGMRRLQLPTRTTNAGLVHLARARALEQLSVRGCKGITDTGLTSCAGLTSLTSLDLEGTRVSDNGMRAVAGLPALRALSLAETAVTDRGVAVLDPLGGLCALNLGQCEITNAALPMLVAMPGLRKLNLAQYPASKLTGDGMAELLPLLELQQLSVGGCHLNIAGLVYLGSILGIRYLDLTETYLSDNRLEKVRPFPELHTLVLLNNPVTDAGLPLLAKLAALRAVYLGYTEVTEQGVQALQKQCPTLRVSYAPPILPRISWDAD